MKNSPQISDTEWYVMKVLWEKAPITANQVIEVLEGTVKWKPKTVKSLISRLIKKGAVGYSKEGREYEYQPLISEKECIKMESQSFLKKISGNALKLVLANFIEQQSLTKDEINELKEILEKKDPKKEDPKREGPRK